MVRSLPLTPQCAPARRATSRVPAQPRGCLPACRLPPRGGGAGPRPRARAFPRASRGPPCRWKRLGGYPRVPGDQIALPEPAIHLWEKVVPLGLVFFAASFNLTILQVGSRRRASASAPPRRRGAALLAWSQPARCTEPALPGIRALAARRCQPSMVPGPCEWQPAGRAAGEGARRRAGVRPPRPPPTALPDPPPLSPRACRCSR